jgi:hypothetical protein
MADDEPLEETEAKTGAAAIASALSRRSRSAAAEKTDAFLEAQTRLARSQLQTMEDESALRLRHLRLRYLGDWLKLGLLMLAILAGALVVAGAGMMVWRASQSHGLAVESFQTPPELANRGLTGPVAARIVVDRMMELVANADAYTYREGASIAGDWGDDVKVEIPETGVSVGDFQRLLRKWLGRETRISGEVYQTATAMAVRLRAGAAPAVIARGADTEALLAQAADSVFAQAQPYRYAVYLENQGKDDEAQRTLAATSALGPRIERAWAYEAWADLLLRKGDILGSRAKAQAALALEPRLVAAFPMYSEYALGHLGRSLSWSLATRNAFRLGRPRDLSADGAAFMSLSADVEIADLTGAYADQARLQESFLNSRFMGTDPTLVRVDQAYYAALSHDLPSAQRALAMAARSDDGWVLTQFWKNIAAAPHFAILAESGDWQSAAADLAAADQAAHAAGNVEHLRRTYVWPWLAYADQRLGRVADVDALISQTPLDCDLCLRMRGRIAAARGDLAGSDRWFSEAVRISPSVPFANTDWGAVRLARGDAAGAIARLQAAHQTGPRFADPLELWGEALAIRGDFAGAAAKYEEADLYAPRWGRNHLMWGRALARLGRPSEARSQYLTASALNLEPADRAAVAELLRRP